MRGRIYAAVMVLLLVVTAILVWASGVGDSSLPVAPPDRPVQRTHTQPQSLPHEEDEPGWDCHRDGNRLCGVEGAGDCDSTPGDGCVACPSSPGALCNLPEVGWSCAHYAPVWRCTTTEGTPPLPPPFTCTGTRGRFQACVTKDTGP